MYIYSHKQDICIIHSQEPLFISSQNSKQMKRRNSAWLRNPSRWCRAVPPPEVVVDWGWQHQHLRRCLLARTPWCGMRKLCHGCDQAPMLMNVRYAHDVWSISLSAGERKIVPFASWEVYLIKNTERPWIAKSIISRYRIARHTFDLESYWENHYFNVNQVITYGTFDDLITWLTYKRSNVLTFRVRNRLQELWNQML